MRLGAVAIAWLAALGAGCGRSPSGEAATNSPASAPVQGRPIPAAGGLTNAGLDSRAAIGSASNTVRVPVSTNQLSGGVLALSFEALAGFPYRIYEYYEEGVAGRPLLKSDDAIPADIGALDGRTVSLRGFVLPLRTRKGRVTEFLLLKDQGTCCFGAQAQINHFIRVTFAAGRSFESGLPYRVTGRLKVGETYAQGYLTGIYQLQADSVEESR